MLPWPPAPALKSPLSQLAPRLSKTRAAMSFLFVRTGAATPRRLRAVTRFGIATRSVGCLTLPPKRLHSV